MTWLPDKVVEHLRAVVEEPDLSGTRYELLQEIGRGGMGVVYLARDTELDRRVALKVLDDLTQEARTLARLAHPGIVPVHDSGSLPDGRAYYVMKFVEGVRLDRYAASKPPLAEALRLFTRICEPLAFAHAQGVVHRDLKPENVMLGAFGEVLVLDWGIAQIEGSGGMTPGTVAGTRGYMSPEQASGRGDAVDGRSDIYALGKLLEYLIRHVEAPRQVRAIAAKASAEDPATRYARVLELSGDVARFLDGQPVTAYRESMIERVGRWLARNKTLAMLILTYLVVRAALLFFSRR